MDSRQSPIALRMPCHVLAFLVHRLRLLPSTGRLFNLGVLASLQQVVLLVLRCQRTVTFCCVPPPARQTAGL